MLRLLVPIFSFLIVCSEGVFSRTNPRADTVRVYHQKEVIVTATRGSGETLEIPMAAGVITANDFAFSRRLSLSDALWSMPGVLAQSRSGGQDLRLTIRGFGARGSGDRSNAAIIRGIKVLLDGVPETEPDGRTPLDMIDLNAVQRIEVVRTNASTLFGNASGGIINIETGSAKLTRHTESSNTFGSFGLRKNNLALGTPYSSGHLYLSATNSAFDGWRQHSNSSSTQMNALVASSLDDATNLKLVASGAINRFAIPGALTQSQFDSDPTTANATYMTRDERRYNRVGRIAFDLSRTFAEQHSLELLAFVNPKVQERSERGTYRDFNRYHLGGGLVYQWNGHDADFVRRVTGGVDEAYQDGTILFYNLVNGQRGDSLRTNKQEGAETFGTFLQAEFRLTDQLNITLGGRYDKQRYIFQDFAAGVKRGGLQELLTFENFTPKAAVLYRISTNHSLYFNYGGGLEVAAFNEIDPPPTIPNVNLNPLLKPMKSTTIEAGAKGFEDWNEGSLIRSVSYSAALFRIAIENEVVPYDGGAYFFSAGASHRLGLELGGQLDLIGGVTLKSALTYLNASYDTYANELGDFSGKAVPGIPQMVWNTRLRYSSDGGLRVELGLENVGEYYADDANTYKVPSSTILNTNVGYSASMGTLTLHGFVGINNIADTKYASSAFINPVAGSFLEPGLPRNYFGGIDLSLEL